MEKILKLSAFFSALLLLVPGVFAQNIFANMVKKLIEAGGMNLLIFIFFAAILYAILRKTKILGGWEAGNAIVALIGSFLIFVYLATSGFDLVKPLSTFMTQSSVLIILLVVSLLAASLFYPDMPKVLGEAMKSPTIIWVMIAVVIALVIVSGLVSVIWSGITAEKPGEKTYKDVILISTSIILFIAVLYLAAAAGRG